MVVLIVGMKIGAKKFINLIKGREVKKKINTDTPNKERI